MRAKLLRIIADRSVTYVVPFRWILEMALGDVLGGITLTCSASEVRPRSSKPADRQFFTLQPQTGTCGSYLQSYLSAAGGYVDNPNATADCRYCQYRVGDELCVVAQVPELTMQPRERRPLVLEPLARRRVRLQAREPR